MYGPMCLWCAINRPNCRNLTCASVCWWVTIATPITLSVLMSCWYCTWHPSPSWSQRRRVWTTSWGTSWRPPDCVSEVCRRPPVWPSSTARPGTQAPAPWTCTPGRVLCGCVGLAPCHMTTRCQRTPVTAATETYLFVDETSLLFLTSWTYLVFASPDCLCVSVCAVTRKNLKNTDYKLMIDVTMHKYVLWSTLEVTKYFENFENQWRPKILCKKLNCICS